MSFLHNDKILLRIWMFKMSETFLRFISSDSEKSRHQPRKISPLVDSNKCAAEIKKRQPAPKMPAPPRGWWVGWEVSGDDGALAAEPGGGVRNRSKGANCPSAASFCPAGSGPCRTGSSQQPGCPFVAVWRSPHGASFLWARKEKNAPPAGRQVLMIISEGKRKIEKVSCGWLDKQRTLLLNRHGWLHDSRIPLWLHPGY